MKSLISLILVFVLCFCLVGCSFFENPSEPITNNSSIEQTDSNEQNGSKEDTPVFDFNSPELRLVNPWHPIPEGFDPELALIDKAYAGFESAQFDASAIDALHALCDAAKADGIKLTVISAYRTNEFQTFNFNRKVERLMAADSSLTREQAEEAAEKVVARPRTSEHQIGLAVDFNSVEDSFKDTKAYAWLVENCTDYGFILRYTKEKQEITRIIPEPWHYRYVGVRAAKKMVRENLCLEEFIEKYNIRS